MAILTDGATRFLEAALARTPRRDVSVRLGRAGSGWSLRLDRAKEGDEVFEHQGQALLVMAEEVAEQLSDAVIDLRETGKGGRLVITRS